MGFNGVGILAWLFLLHLAAISFFSTGFLLTRFEITEKSTCESRPLDFEGDHSIEDGCWLPKRFDKAIMVVIDALRYDYIAHIPDDDVAASQDQPYYVNQLKSVRRALEQQPNNALLYRFVADAPTVTMQRLKGLTTGSLPTFIDISANFHGTEIHEDNWLSQLDSQGKVMTFMGDDTWMGLFPNAFNRSYPYPSFNVKDLHTVDNGCIEHLQPEMANSDWTLLISHFLGVDHVGHRYEANNAVMESKLTQMDGVIDKIMENMDESTLLIVFGDHGMTEDGNHGGATDEEVNAGLFLYSKSKQLLRNDYTHHEINTIPQISLVPTISLLLGVPIPFNNLGAVIPPLFYFGQEPQQNLAKALAVNSAQVYRYLMSYSENAQTLPPSTFNRLREEYDQVHTDYNMYRETEEGNLEEICERYQRFLTEALSMCRDMWATFDLTTMYYGIGMMILALGVSILLLCVTLSEQSSGQDFPVALVGLCGVLVFTTTYVLETDASMRALYRASVFGIVGSSLGYILGIIFQPGSRSNHTHPKREGTTVSRFPSIIAWVLVALQGYSLVSNSFIVAEDSVVHFFTATLVLVTGLNVARKEPHQFYDVATFAFVALLSIRIASTRTRFGQEAFATDSVTVIAWIDSLVPLALIPISLTVVVRRFFGVSLPFSNTVMLYLSAACVGMYNGLLIMDPPQDSTSHYLLELFPCLCYVVTAVHCAKLAIQPFLIGIGLAVSKAQKQSRRVVALRATMMSLVVALSLPISMVLGPASTLSVLCMLVACFCIIHTNNIGARGEEREIPLPSSCVLLGLVAMHFFHTTGHMSNFNTLQYSAGFVGFSEFNFLLSGLLLGLNTFGPHLMAMLLVVTIVPLVRHDGSFERRLAAAYVMTSIPFVLQAAVMCVCVTIHRRHLMVWAIFAPKFCFSAVTLLVVDICCCLGAFFGSAILSKVARALPLIGDRGS